MDDMIADVVGPVLLLAGAALFFFAGIGTVRFNNLYARMHAATKAPTLGLVLVATGVALQMSVGHGKVLLAVVFVFLTAPCAAHMLGRISYQASGVAHGIDGPDHYRTEIVGAEIVGSEPPPRSARRSTQRGRASP